MKKIAIVALALSAAVALAGCEQGTGHTLSDAELRNANYAGQQYSTNADLKFIQCSGLDSEPDGYVSCTAKDKTTGADKTLSCSYQGTTAGCKPK